MQKYKIKTIGPIWKGRKCLGGLTKLAAFQEKKWVRRGSLKIKYTERKCVWRPVISQETKWKPWVNNLPSVLLQSWQHVCIETCGFIMYGQWEKSEEAKLTVEDFIELSWWGMDDEVGHYAYLQKQNAMDQNKKKIFMWCRLIAYSWGKDPYWLSCDSFCSAPANLPSLPPHDQKKILLTVNPPLPCNQQREQRHCVAATQGVKQLARFTLGSHSRLAPSSLLFCATTLPVSRSHVKPTASQQPLPPPAWLNTI